MVSGHVRAVWREPAAQHVGSRSCVCYEIRGECGDIRRGGAGRESSLAVTMQLLLASLLSLVQAGPTRPDPPPISEGEARMARYLVHQVQPAE